jgi:hypothetical protein
VPGTFKFPVQLGERKLHRQVAAQINPIERVLSGQLAQRLLNQMSSLGGIVFAFFSVLRGNPGGPDEQLISTTSETRPGKERGKERCLPP